MRIGEVYVNRARFEIPCLFMAMMTQAAVERRFLDPASIQYKYQLARMHHSCPLRFSAVAGGGWQALRFRWFLRPARGSQGGRYR